MQITLTRMDHEDKVLVANQLTYPDPQPEGAFRFELQAAGGKHYELEVTDVRELSKFVIEANNRLTELTRPKR